MCRTIWIRENYTISTDRSLLDREIIYQYLSEESYWAKGMPRTTFEQSFKHSSLCFGLFNGNPKENQAQQVGFARVVSDLATFAYLADVFILEPHRGKGLSKWLMEVILKHPDLKELRRFMLATKDAHSLYEKFGFQSLAHPEKMMEIARGRSIYQ